MHISDWSSDVCSSDLYGRNLYGRERAIVVIAFDAGQSIDQLLVAHHETDSPTGHVVAFAHGEELDGDIARTLDLHAGRPHIAVEGDVGVSQIVNHQNIVLFGHGDDTLEEDPVDTLSRGMDGKTQDPHLRLGSALPVPGRAACRERMC